MTCAALVNDFVKVQVPAGADGQIDRAARRLGLIAAAGEIADHGFGVDALARGRGDRDAAGLGRWRNGSTGAAGPNRPKLRQAIAQVRHFIEAHGEARFDSLDDADARAGSKSSGLAQGRGRGSPLADLAGSLEIGRLRRPRREIVARTSERGAACWRRSDDGYQKVEKISRNVRSAFMSRHAAHFRRGRGMKAGHARAPSPDHAGGTRWRI